LRSGAYARLDNIACFECQAILNGNGTSLARPFKDDRSSRSGDGPYVLLSGKDYWWEREDDQCCNCNSADTAEPSL
jgi:hypothetical protein